MPWSDTDKLILSALLPTEASRVRLARLCSKRGAAVDQEALLRRAGAQGIAPLLRFNLSRAGLLHCLPAGAREALADISRLQAARHMAYVSEICRLARILAEEDIAALPLKGAALMLGDYYPQAGLRFAMDIDLLIEPGRLEQAERVVAASGYDEVIITTSARPRQRLANERNHLPPRRGPGGLVLELHHRAFHHVRHERDFTFADFLPRVTRRRIGNTEVTLPGAADLSLHLIHHTIVDLQSTHSILRTLADLFFISRQEPQVLPDLRARARELHLDGAVDLACETLQWLSEATPEQLDQGCGNEPVRLLLDTALLEETAGITDAARLYEYFDLRRRPFTKLGNLLSLVFTSRRHMAELYGEPATGRIYLKYLRRPFDLLRKFNRAGLSPGSLRRVIRLKKLTGQEAADK